MIEEKDAELHPAAAGDPLWAETNYFGFEVPDVPLHIGLYSLFRPNLGVVNSAIFANSRRVTSSWETDYWDHRAYLPMKSGQSLLDFELRNSLKVTCREPNKIWDLHFNQPGLLEVDVRFDSTTTGTSRAYSPSGAPPAGTTPATVNPLRCVARTQPEVG